MIKTGKGPKAITSAKSIREAERRAEMLSLRLEGKTLEQIGAHMNVGADTVHRVISRALTSVTKEPAEELLTLELGRCDVLLSEAMQTVKAFHPLVSAGRVVSAPMLTNQGEPIRNPETGDVLTRVLEDKAPKLAAIHTAVKVMERRAKLLGLDAPSRMQADLNVSTDEKKPYDLSRLDMNEVELLDYLMRKAEDPDATPAARKNLNTRWGERSECPEELTPDEMATVKEVFRKLGVKYLLIDTVDSWRVPPALPAP
ncbi:MAG: helix-turn-helix domain-containing protein [Dechloromonas sp.]|nr:helix-turn-helix domain-containing protein [Dechloromonas sp.]